VCNSLWVVAGERQYLVGMSAVRQQLVVFYHHMTRHKTSTWKHDVSHPQNRKYITYRNAVRGGPSHGHRQHAQKFDMRADRQTEKLITILGTHPGEKGNYYTVMWCTRCNTLARLRHCSLLRPRPLPRAPCRPRDRDVTLSWQLLSSQTTDVQLLYRLSPSWHVTKHTKSFTRFITLTS